MSHESQTPHHDAPEGAAASGSGGQGHTPISVGKVLLLLFLLLVVAVALAVAGILPRLRQKSTLQKETEALAVPAVMVANPKPGQPTQEIVLPGNIYAWTDSPIYARTSGYLKQWHFDIGSRVKKGQLLAVIESPEVDQQLAQAKADLATAEANAHNAKIQAARYQDLLQQNAVTKQDTDNFVTQEASTSTQVKSALANVQRLQELVSFENIYAPFDGVITARDVDTGTLIDAGANKEMFHMADEHVLRVYVNVPQVESAGCRPGVAADLTFAERPGVQVQGKIVRTADSIDPTSRTLLVEVDVNNSKGEIFPGAYTEVHFHVKSSRPALILPVPALIFRSEGLRVAIVDSNNKAKLVPITISQDDGRTVQVVQGLEADDRVIQNPPDSIVDGEPVRVVQPQSEHEGGEGESGAPGPGTGGGR
ncbi:efflux RND transporter periplasmic adaptor subunit [Paracidobacterium acidisoli]|uniref:Efflux RND transporter periplasmic adaptor subunit n=1 Tax=Paracidobacterium acidisoli TaxID=2303751 RepID=A0A372IMX3_9BACT|nr:efflux RND transporter periplasmic adaptor subunit [Paracidobacterium acidisoli]MBT9331721.1 efflux RND transporter periplasmic adaptor subunit [Paracidobacterium acidisoli]